MPVVTVDITDLRAGTSRLVELEGRSILVCRSAGGVHATDGICPHQVKTLDGARVRGETVMCPHHGARFRLSDGASQSFALTARPLPVYPAEAEGDTLRITLPD